MISDVRERVEWLINRYCGWDRFPPKPLGSDDDVSFGLYGFHYDAARVVLIGRVFVEYAWPSDADAATIANGWRVFRALDDPAIGGKFDHGGGTFVLDESLRTICLARELPTGAAAEHALRVAMDHLRDVAAAWQLHWLFRVARIVHGWEPRPTAFTAWTAPR
jgi:hypothetical protein